MREDSLLQIKLINQKGSADALRSEIEQAIPKSGLAVSTSVDLPLSHEAKGVLSRAAEEAEKLKHRSIDSGHLVLGVFAMKGKAAEALSHNGVSFHAYREALAVSEETAPAPSVSMAPAAPQPVSPESAPTTVTAAAALREPVSKLNQLIEQMIPLAAETPDDFGDRRLKRKPWTRKEALGHLIDWAAIHQGWFARALTEPRLTVSGYPDDSWVAVQRYSEISWTNLMELLVSMNRLLAHVLSGIPEEKVGMSCRIGIEGPTTLQTLIAAYIDHLEDIIGQLLAHG